MLLEFQFQNYKSFHGATSFSMKAESEQHGLDYSLSVDATQAASQVVCDLCSETERMAFIIGLHAGMQFAWEVTEPTEVKL